jgi:hypothetical protein
VLSVIDRSARPVVTLRHKIFSCSLFLFPHQVRQSVPPGLGFTILVCSRAGPLACFMLMIFHMGQGLVHRFISCASVRFAMCVQRSGEFLPCVIFLSASECSGSLVVSGHHFPVAGPGSHLLPVRLAWS